MIFKQLAYAHPVLVQLLEIAERESGRYTYMQSRVRERQVHIHAHGGRSLVPCKQRSSCIVVRVEAKWQKIRCGQAQGKLNVVLSTQ